MTTISMLILVKAEVRGRGAIDEDNGGVTEKVKESYGWQ